MAAFAGRFLDIPSASAQNLKSVEVLKFLIPKEPPHMSGFRFAVLLSLIAVGSTLLHASDDNPDRTRFGHDIRVSAGENVADLTCFFCSIYVRGNAAGDVTAFGGRIEIEGPAQIAGDVTTIVGDVNVGPGSKIAGDLTAVGGSIQRASDAEIGGDVTPIHRGWWLTLLLFSPLIVLGILIAAIVWLIQYLRRPRGLPAAV